jgi:hypothetical protein
VAKSKRKNKIVKRKGHKPPTKPIISEYGEWKTGDICWVVPVGTHIPTQAEILEFFPNDNIAPAAAVITRPDGKYRAVKCSLLAETRKEAKEIYLLEKSGDD